MNNHRRFVLKRILIGCTAVATLVGGAYFLLPRIIEGRIDVKEANIIIARGCAARIRLPSLEKGSTDIVFFFLSKRVDRKTVEPDVFCLFENRLASCTHAKRMILSSGRTLPDGETVTSESCEELSKLEVSILPMIGTSAERIQAVFGEPALDRRYPNQFLKRKSYFELNENVVLYVAYRDGEAAEIHLRYKNVGPAENTRDLGEGIHIALQPVEAMEILLGALRDASEKYSRAR